MAKVQVRGLPSDCQIPGPAPIPCGLPPLWSQDAFHIMWTSVEIAATGKAALTTLFRHVGRVGVFFAWKEDQQARNSRKHGSRKRIPTAMYSKFYGPVSVIETTQI